MALIVSEDFKIAIVAREEGTAMRLKDHDIPGLEGHILLISMEREVAESIWRQMGEGMGLLKEEPKIHLPGHDDAPKEEGKSGITD